MPHRSKALDRIYREKAVYWGNPVGTGAGGRTFDPAIEIDVRWDNRAENFRDADTGETRVSRAVVYPKVAVVVSGYLWRGEIDSLSSAEQVDPLVVDDAFEIRQIADETNTTGTKTVRTAWL
jgi:hypothetical protein